MNGSKPPKKYVVSPPISFSDIKTRNLETVISELNVDTSSPRSRITGLITPVEKKFRQNKDIEQKISSKMEQKIQELKSMIDRLANMRKNTEQKIDSQIKKIHIDLKREYNKKISPEAIEKPLEDEIINQREELKEYFDDSNENLNLECVKRITALIDSYNKLAKRIIQEREDRERKYEEIIETLGNDIFGLNDSLIEMKKHREELVSSIKDSLTQHKEKLLTELKKEKNEREKNETMLIKLLECIIDRYEQTSSF